MVTNNNGPRDLWTGDSGMDTVSGPPDPYGETYGSIRILWVPYLVVPGNVIFPVYGS